MNNCSYYISLYIIKLTLQCPRGYDGIKEMTLKLENSEGQEVDSASIQVDKCINSNIATFFSIYNEDYYNLTLSATSDEGVVFPANPQHLSEYIYS